MSLVTAVRDYINRMLQDISGMKVLILDSHTVRPTPQIIRLFDSEKVEENDVENLSLRISSFRFVWKLRTLLQFSCYKRVL